MNVLPMKSSGQAETLPMKGTQAYRDPDTAHAVKKYVARLEVVVYDSSTIFIEVGQSLENLCHDDFGFLLRQKLHKL